MDRVWCRGRGEDGHCRDGGVRRLFGKNSCGCCRSDDGTVNGLTGVSSPCPGRGVQARSGRGESKRIHPPSSCGGCLSDRTVNGLAGLSSACPGRGSQGRFGGGESKIFFENSSFGCCFSDGAVNGLTRVSSRSEEDRFARLRIGEVAFALLRRGIEGGSIVFSGVFSRDC